ncbi:MAG: ABC transporter permease [Pseudochelatococcus sp.]|jgi:putative spermidine/putrescine transport system permease protein|uniref:ABC transporter permease n=1 Tax=Pseudochelatococcus sp. TaxID=2020869 RepID=UPI003D8CF970
MQNAHGTRLTALLVLIVPVVVYALVYLTPLFSVMSLSVDNSALSKPFAHLSRAIDSEEQDERAAALLADLTAMDPRTRAEAARMLNQELSGFRSLLMDTGRVASTIPPTMAGLTQHDARWADPAYWDVLANAVSSITWRHFQRATGIRPDGDGKLTIAKGDDIYLQIMLRTFVIGFQVTALTLLIAYPLAYAVANSSRQVAGIILTLVLMSFWTSILVRTTAWLVLLQSNGLINSLLMALNLITEPLQLIFNRFGTVVAMTHVVLPFAILPMINVMKTIPRSQVDASRSLGAGPIETFIRVYFPQTLRGVFVGGGTVFILSLGFYVTPALTGGPGDQMLSYYIVDFIRKGLNWGMASVLSVILLFSVILLVLIGAGIRQLTNRRKAEA